MVQIARDNLDSLNKLTEKIIGLAIEVDKKIGLILNFANTRLEIKRVIN
ncbi:MAG: hypothetical protein K9L87_01325 [Candidatus Omnitrophica bacterium]|jgi:hypothetical protein|nr:hypothetical protein [Candidatus Omnitrophota bacterium]MCF7877739.1 hypothetical protein [Candidatus Omnitrophota bacterium]MCF7891501.1 hypothetical protein [Candidatus Omnitrophota bacterium]MCF7896078.1 hypothetical protein [Candidatus Omnitrophota bacterium]MCF7897387.1 hypothetical protein [Candidatus Omnitrophota bacterium]